MENQVLVSVLIPVYKVEKYIGKCVESVFTQTYPNIEYIFVNDCTPDRSIDVIKEYIIKHKISKEKYTIINHKQNEGIAVSRTDCIANAKGDYVLFVDSDDWIESNMVEELVKATKNGSIDIIGSDFAKDFLSGETTIHQENYAETCKENIFRSLNYDISTVLWKLLIRRNLFDNFTITPHVDIVEDYIMSVKLYYYAKSFAAVHQCFYHYVQYNQARVSFQTQRSVSMHIKGVNEVEQFCREKGIYNDYVEHKLLLRKFNIKSNFLTKSLLDYDAYKTTFPEANKVWREIGYSRNERIKFWLAEKNLYFILKMILGKQNLTNKSQYGK